MQEQKDKKFTREALLKSKRFENVQRDFLAAILTNDFYTIPEAQKAINEAMGKTIGGKENGGRNLGNAK